MTVERSVDENGIVTYSEETPPDMRQVEVGQVVSLVPPLVQVPGRFQPLKIKARTVGLVVGVGDLVLVCRVSGGVCAVSKVEVL